MIPALLAAGLLVAASFAPVASVTPADVRGWVDQFGAAYRLEVGEFAAVAECESGFDPWAVGAAGELGPYQWLPRGGLWDWTPAGRAGLSPLAPRLNVAMAAWAFAQGAAWKAHWSCWVARGR